MIAVDTNILVYAHRAEMEQHARGMAALTEIAEGAEPWGLPIFVANEFVRVVTHPRIFHEPTSRAQAVAAIQALLESPTVVILHPGQRFWPLMQQTLEEGDARGDLVLDAAIVALCREHGVSEILSADRDFRRFPSISLRTVAEQ